MAKPKAIKHTHKILRFNGGHSYVYKCANPDCCYLLQHAQLYHLVGRASICWSCGEKFSLTEDSLREEFPTCDNCQVPEVKEYIQEIEGPKSELDLYLEALKEHAKSNQGN